MIKNILKKLFKVMIEFGQNIIKGLSFGTHEVQYVHFGDTQVYPVEYYIVLETSSIEVDEQQDSYVFTVSSNTTDWQVSSSDNWFEASKISNTQVLFTVTENDMYETREGYIYLTIDGITYATFTISQTGSALYIIIPATGNTIDNAAQHGYIPVSANTTEWSVSVSPSNGISVRKDSNSQIYYEVEENSGATNHIYDIVAEYNGISDTFRLTQEAGYYFAILTQSPVTIGSATTAFTLSVQSLYKQVPFSGVNASIPSSEMDVRKISMTGASGQYDIRFSCDANDTTSARSIDITLVQSESLKNGVVTVTQNPKYEEQTISGFTVVAEYNGWQLGTYANGINVVIAILSPTEPTQSYTATWDLTYDFVPPGTTTSLTGATSGTRTIATTDTVSIPDGDTAYGITLDGRPNLYNVQVNTFTVEAVE